MISKPIAPSSNLSEPKKQKNKVIETLNADSVNAVRIEGFFFHIYLQKI